MFAFRGILNQTGSGSDLFFNPDPNFLEKPDPDKTKTPGSEVILIHNSA